MDIEDFAWQYPFNDVAFYIEADGKTCYAYVGQEDDGIYNFYGDVWLFNIIDAPDQPVWDSEEPGPYANPVGYARPFNLGETVSPSDFSVEERFKGGSTSFAILYRGEEIGLVWDGAAPGLSRFAVKDGPLAGVMK